LVGLLVAEAVDAVVVADVAAAVDAVLADVVDVAASPVVDVPSALVDDVTEPDFEPHAASARNPAPPNSRNAPRLGR
jgi:hypothetical protein